MNDPVSIAGPVSRSLDMVASRVSLHEIGVAPEEKSAKFIATSIRRAHFAWVKLVAKLQEAKLQLSDDRVSFLQSCPPAGVAVRGPTRRHCNLAASCPFCWSRRYAAEPYRRLQNCWNSVADQQEYQA